MGCLREAHGSRRKSAGAKAQMFVGPLYGPTSRALIQGIRAVTFSVVPTGLFNGACKPGTASWAKFSRPYGTRLCGGHSHADSAPETAIKCAVLNRLCNMPHRDPRLGIKVCDGTSDLQYPVVRSRAQALLLHGPLQQTFGFR
jgi:hypothetical protein